MAKLNDTQVYGHFEVKGEIINKATTTSEGVVKLNDSVTSTSTTEAATANAVKTAYDKANHDHPYASTSVATTSSNGLMSSTDKSKLDGIATGANNYSHPTTSGNKHIPSGGSEGQILRWSADGTAVWGADNNTTYSIATTTSNGLMSSGDKTKLDGIATGANNYTHPSTHPVSMISGLHTVATSGNYSDLENKPSTFPPSSHTHSEYLPTTGGTITGNIGFEGEIYTKINGSAVHVQTILKSVLDGNINADIANKLKHYTSRPASADLAVEGNSTVKTFLATASMTTSKPPAGDGYITHYEWDNTGGYSAQLYLKNSKDPKIQIRGMSSGTWGDWQTVYATNNKPTPADIGAANALTSANGYYGMTHNDGTTSNWVRTTINGILPYQGGGASSLGTSYWQFNNIYGVNIYANGVNIGTEIANLKSSVVSGKQAVVNAIDGKLGYASGLTTSHTHSDLAWWITNRIIGPRAPYSTTVSKYVSWYPPILADLSITATNDTATMPGGYTFAIIDGHGAFGYYTPDNDIYVTPASYGYKWTLIKAGTRTLVSGVSGNKYVYVFNPMGCSIKIESTTSGISSIGINIVV